MDTAVKKERAGHYRKVRDTFWGDRKVRDLSLVGKGLFLLVMVHPNMTSLGAMRATIPGLAAELDESEEAFREVFGEALDKGMIAVDEKACLITFPNFVRHNEPESPNVVRSWAHVILSLPECPLLYRHILRSGNEIEGMHVSFQKAFHEALTKAFPHGFPKAMGNTEPEPETDNHHHHDQGSNSVDGGGGGNGFQDPDWPELEALMARLGERMTPEE